MRGRRRHRLGAQAITETEPYLVVEVSGDDYALPLLSVTEIVRPQDLQPATDAPPALRGVMCLRERRLAVLDLATAFGSSAGETTPDTCVLVTADGDEDHGITRALVVDRIRGLVHLESTAIVGVPKIANILEVEFVAAVATLERAVIPVLDLQHLLDLETLRDAFAAAQQTQRAGVQ